MIKAWLNCQIAKQSYYFVSYITSATGTDGVCRWLKTVFNPRRLRRD